MSPQPGSTPPDPNDIHIRLDQWLKGIRIWEIAYYKAAAHYNQRNRQLGLGATILSVIVGTSLFTSLNSSASALVLAGTGSISALAAVLVGAQTFLNYGQLAEQTRTAATKYGALRHMLEEDLATKHSEAELATVMGNVGTQWDLLEQQSPTISNQIYDEAQRFLDPARKRKRF